MTYFAMDFEGFRQPLCSMRHLAPSYVAFKIAMIFSGMPLQSRLTLSKAFSKSMKIICRYERNYLLCSMLILTELMWSVHDESALEPACSASTVEIKGSLIRSSITFAIIFETAGRTQIPRQLSQSRKLPFFGILTIMPSVQSLGRVSLTHAS